MYEAIFKALGAIMVLILVDAAFGIILGIRAKTFDVRKLPQFLATNLVPYVGGLLVLALAACWAGDYTAQMLALFYAAAAATAAKFIAEIKDKVVKIFGQIDLEVSNIEDLNADLVVKIREAIIDAVQAKSTQ